MVGRTRHKQTRIKVHGASTKVDKDMAPLIKAVNDAGLVSLYSCQKSGNDLAYLMLDMDYIYEVSIDKRALVITWAHKNPIRTSTLRTQGRGIKLVGLKLA